MTKIFFSILFLIVFVSAVSAQKDRAISEIQGDNLISSFEGQTARLTGIVTARIKNGFFLQTPDDKIDSNPATSEGVFVFTGSEPPAEATVGNLVKVTGFVTEFRPKDAPLSLPLTELSMKKEVDKIEVVSKDNPLPKAVVLTETDFGSNQIDELEKYEAMRVAVEDLTVVAPTGGKVDVKTMSAASDGVFFGVLKGIPRPFRGPGLDIYEYLLSKDREEIKKNFPNLPLFDSNPETIRVDSDEQLGAQAIDVTAKAEIKNLAGVMYYAYQNYTILTDAGAKPEISNLIKASAMPLPTDRQFTIAGMNLENFFDDEDDPSIKEEVVTTEAFEKKLKKISTVIRAYIQSPDIIGTVEVENLAALKRLAKKINDDAAAAGKPNPKYEAYLVDGNDGRGIDVGFLVKSARVNVSEVKQLGKDEKFKNDKGEEEILNDRPPLLLRATIDDQKTGKPFAVTIIVNHLKSFLGIETERVRIKRKMQSEFLARYVQGRQKADSNERIILIGDFNAFQFNDGIGDIIGTIKGAPAPKEQVLFASEDLVNPDLTDLVDKIQEPQRYSYVYDGNAQVLDHFLISETLKKYLAGFGYARVNADFPEIYRNEAMRVERYSDHDPAIGYFSLDEKAAAK
ncbi:MAG TPA: hypothetical protein VGC76_09860 [Pyrinomonadaceae bacterium]